MLLFIFDFWGGCLQHAQGTADRTWLGPLDSPWPPKYHSLIHASGHMGMALALPVAGCVTPKIK